MAIFVQTQLCEEYWRICDRLIGEKRCYLLYVDL